MDHVRVMTPAEGQRPLIEENVLKSKKGLLHNPNQTFLPLQCMVMDDDATPATVEPLLAVLQKPKAEEEDDVPFKLGTSGGNHFCEAYHRVMKEHPQLGGERLHLQRAEVPFVVCC